MHSQMSPLFMLWCSEISINLSESEFTSTFPALSWKQGPIDGKNNRSIFHVVRCELAKELWFKNSFCSAVKKLCV